MEFPFRFVLSADYRDCSVSIG